MIFALTYLLVMLFTMRRVAWHALSLERTRVQRNSWGDQIGSRDYHWCLSQAVAYGALVAAGWPYYWSKQLFLYTSNSHNQFWRRLLTSEPSQARKKRKLEESRRRTAELEQELGI